MQSETVQTDVTPDQAALCQTCGSTLHKQHIFRETMLATHEEFPYTECLDCGALQIASIPPDMAPFYPDTYYSFSKPSIPWWKGLFYGLHFLDPEEMMRISPCGLELESVIACEPEPFARILDVGSGSGHLVATLRRVGFRAHGVDPYSQQNPYVRYASLDDVQGEWDLIMFHHSLEHMSSTIDILRQARSLLAPGGTCLVRIPVVNWAYRHYGRDWYQIDAPRHLVLHTPSSFERAASKAGFNITRTVYDSGPGQFFFSEYARRGIPIANAPRPEDIFPPETIDSYIRQTQLLNLCRMSDQAAFYLKAIEAVST